MGYSRSSLSAKLTKLREDRGKTIQQVADDLNISPLLVYYLETNQVTHPNIAKRVALYFGLTDEEMYLLMPKNRRPGPDYDPDKYYIYNKDPLIHRRSKHE